MKTADEICNLIRDETEKAGGIPAWCEDNGMGTSYVYEVLRGMRQPSAKLANIVGYRRVIRFEPFENQN